MDDLSPPCGGFSREPTGFPNDSPAHGWAWNFRLGAGSESATEGTVPPSDIRSDKLARLEAALFVADGPLTPKKLAQVALLADGKEANALLTELGDSLERTDSSFRVTRVASGYQLMTTPAYVRWLDRLHRRQEGMALSPAALETLTIIAYRQPTTRADLESLRGINSTEMLKQLLERGLIRIAGTEDTLGRPFLYETTRGFLERFGLRSIADLPDGAGLRRTA